MEENTQEIVEEEKKPNLQRYYILGLLSGMLLAIIVIGAGAITSKLYSNYKAMKAISTNGTTSDAVPDSGKFIDENMISKMATIKTIIDKYYLDEYTDDMIRDGVYDGMMASLGDRYAEYYTEEEMKELTKVTGGYFCGIGATVSIDKESNLCVIVEPIADSPAEKAGLIPGDLIYKVDGKDTTGMELDDVVQMIRGEEGTIVHLTIVREGEPDVLEMDIARGKVDSTSVGYEMLEDNIGHIVISTFDDNTADQFVDALATLKGEGAKGMIIDLRSNLGGNVTAVVDICENILPKGIIVYTLDRDGNREEYNSDGEHEIGMPLVVLVNQYSASASEILTGAVKDHGVGLVVGTTTYGKGVVQKVISLKDGSAVKLTCSKYYTPSGVCINGTGIDPDVTVELDYDNYKNNGIDNQLDAAAEEVKKLIK